jgi:hypothetical protein
MRSVTVALAAGWVLTAIAVGVVLSGSPLIVAGSNSVVAYYNVAHAKGSSGTCEVGGTVPPGTTAIRISADSQIGPRVTVKVLSGQVVATSGQRAAGWGFAETVTVPVERVRRPIHAADICLAFGPALERLRINGTLARAKTSAGAGGTVRLRFEYLRPGEESWWSLASSIARRMGFGHAPAGAWVVFVLVAIMITLAILASHLILSGAGAGAGVGAGVGVGSGAGRRPAGEVGAILRPSMRPAWTCAVIACLNAACWSVLTPPFQAPDEPAHFAYVQQLAETARLPTSSGTAYSPEEEVAQADLHHIEVRWHPENHPVATPVEQRRLQADLAQPLGRDGSGGAGVAASEPPLYYALQAIPYWLGSSGTLLDRLELMRLLSALMAGLTAFFTYLFVREAAPGAPWAWVVGGLGVALTPLLAFMSGTVNPDAMLYAVSAASFYLLARAFRRGLTPRLGAGLGIAIAIGSLTKLNFIGFAPGLLVALVVLAWRAARSSRRTAYRSVAIAGAIAVSPACVYIVANLLSHRAGLGLVSGAIDVTNGRHSVTGELSYIWQFYFPRLPGMTNDFAALSTTTRQIWFDRSVGFYGLLDTSFPTWVENIALIPAALLVIFLIRALVGLRATIRRRIGELVAYAAMGVGLMMLIGADSYLVFPAQAGTYGEPRYLLPMIALLGPALALSARGAGRRWGPAAGALIVTLFLAHDLFSQLQVVARFYG